MAASFWGIIYLFQIGTSEAEFYAVNISLTHAVQQ